MIARLCQLCELFRRMVLIDQKILQIPNIDKSEYNGLPRQLPPLAL